MFLGINFIWVPRWLYMCVDHDAWGRYYRCVWTRNIPNLVKSGRASMRVETTYWLPIYDSLRRWEVTFTLPNLSSLFKTTLEYFFRVFGLITFWQLNEGKGAHIWWKSLTMFLASAKQLHVGLASQVRTCGLNLRFSLFSNVILDYHLTLFSWHD